jgi:ATP/maltotriose-dependent transcriptional regulator MalT
MIFIIDSAGRYTGFSSGNTVQPLVPPELFIGRTIFDVLPVDLARSSMEAIHTALATQELQVVTYELWEGDGFRQYQCRIAPAGSDEVVALVRDQSADLFHQTRQERLREREHLETRAEGALLGENRYGLSFREFTVLELLEQGVDDRDIARKLGLPRASISRHVASILTKLGVQSRTAAAVVAIKLGLIPA